MSALLEWQQAVIMPVVARGNPDWTSDELEGLLLAGNRTCAVSCLERCCGSAIHICLSGGLDSSLSLAMVRKAFPSEPIRAYTIGGGPRHPDIQMAMLVAESYDASHTLIIPSERDITCAREEHPCGKGVDEGGIGLYILYRHLAFLGAKCVLAHDGIDELMGGYWAHRGCGGIGQMITEFEKFWQQLVPQHLEPLHDVARHFDIQVEHPYLTRDIVSYISRIPLDDRTDRIESKKPLRAIGRRYNLPNEILNRSKRGLCDALKKE